MILRVFYLLIIATGVGLFFMFSNIDLLYILKAVVGLWVIGLFEMILTRLLIIEKPLFLDSVCHCILVVLYLGFDKLPMSIFHV